MKRILTQALIAVIFASSAFAGESSVFSEGSTPTPYLGSVTGAGGTNEGGSQGVQADEFTGAATYAVPIQLPPGRGGIEPKLVLNYNSHRKNPNSWVGYGWELDIGSIIRIPNQGIVDYVSGTDFEYRLGGQAETLVLLTSNQDLSTYGITGKGDVYASKIESSYNIYLHIKEGGEDLGWCVIDKSGRKYLFGSNALSREQKEENGELWIAKWALIQVTDPNGNWMEVEYIGSGLLPTKITYDDIEIVFTKIKTTDDESANLHYFPLFRQGFFGWEQVTRLIDIYVNRVVDFQTTERLQRIALDYVNSKRNAAPLLNKITKYGKNDSVSLPPIIMSYYEGEGLEFGLVTTSKAYAKVYKSDGTTEPNDGPIGWNRMFIDLNGDGLADQVMGFPETGKIYVRINKLGSFAESQEWKDPFSGNSDASGSLSVFSDDNQSVAIIDMNGDSLPDRVKRTYTGSDWKKSSFKIVFNSGKGWDGGEATWKDPYEGDNSGTISANRGLIDMNGDGLVDRVAKAKTNPGFRVYFNTGAGFKSTYEYWKDPFSVGNPVDTPGIGKIRAYEDDKLYADIRDINGDGLPDRIYSVYILTVGKNNEVSQTPAFHADLNLNGHGWAQPDLINDCPVNVGGMGPCATFDVIDSLGLIDPVENADSKGWLADATHDLIDFNGDGYLDRIEGDTESGKFRIYFYKGLSLASNDIHFGKTAFTIDDPIKGDYSNAQDTLGYVYNSNAIFQDINGDNYPDRIGVVDGSESKKDYAFYNLKFDAIPFSGEGLSNFPSASQLSNGLKALNNGQGFRSVTEYLPSSWPWNGDTPVNTFLPTPIFTIHKLYIRDTTAPPDEDSYEGKRNPHMRWTTFWYSGGNIFVRYGKSEVPYISRFNGFHRLVKSHQPMPGEDWLAYNEIAMYHQALGDVPIAKDYEGGYSHFALTGKLYGRELKEGDIVRRQEVSTWSVNAAAQTGTYTNIECTTPVCKVTLDKKRVYKKEAGSSSANYVDTTYKYDDVGNVTQEKLWGNGSAVVRTVNTYVPPGTFGDLQIRDRLATQTQQYETTIYRKKEFQYDPKGNPIKDILSVDGANKTEEITRKFSLGGGNIVEVTGTDGVTRTIDYDAKNLFPTGETIINPTGPNLKITRDFLRLTGRMSSELNPQDVGAKTVSDDFGRPIEEHLVEAGGGTSMVGRHTYEYIIKVVNETDKTILKTSHFRYQLGYLETLFTLPLEVTFTDETGFALQRCALSERGTYRVTYARRYNDGRIVKETEPVFKDGCNFAEGFPSNIPHSIMVKDVLGRPVSITPPTGDADSPTGPVAIKYQLSGSLTPIKEITLPKGQKRIETYDAIGRLSEVNGTVGDKLSFLYNPVGDILAVKSGATTLNITTYDLLGRKLETTDADMGNWKYKYELGRLEKQTDAKGQTIEFAYDAISRVTQKTYHSANGAVEKTEDYKYDDSVAGYDVMKGELASVTETGPNGKLTSQFSYDPIYRRIAKMSRGMPGVGEFSQTFVHNMMGQVTGTQYQNSAFLNYTYNMIGGLKQVCENGDCKSGEVYYELDPDTGYNAQGSLLEEKFGNGVKATYDYYAKSHRMSKKAIGLEDKTYSERKFTYDAQSNITSLLDQKGLLGAVSIKSAKYDTADRLTDVELTGAASLSMMFDASGNVVKNSTVYGNLVYEYLSGRPHAVTKIGAGESFTYDANGNMTSDVNRTMTYNVANQLTKVVMKNGAEVSYDYDYAGTRVLKKVSTKDLYGKKVEYKTHYLGNAIEIKVPISPSPQGGEGQGEGEIILHIYAEGKLIASRYIGKASDVMVAPAAGGWMSLRAPAGGVAIPRLQIALLAALLIALFPGVHVIPAKAGIPCPSLRGVRRRWTTRQSPAYNWPLVYRTAAIAIVAIILFHTPLSLAGDAGLALKPVSDVEFLIYHHGDHLGSTHLITEGKKLGRHAGITYPRGTVIQRFEYLPWGQEAFALNPNQSYDPRFTGQEYDIETGLYFYKARYYNPALGRFIQPDSLVQDPTDPQSYNRYAYVRNNPLKYIDPSGHEFEQFSLDVNTDFKIDPELPAEAERIKNEGAADRALASGGLLGNTTASNRNSNLGAVATVAGYAALNFITGGNASSVVGAFRTITNLGPELSPEDEMIMSAAMMSGGIANVGKLVRGVAVGTRVSRYWGGESGPFGKSWTRDPINLHSRNSLGLETKNTATFMSRGTVIDNAGIKSQQAREWGRFKGGGNEIEIIDANQKIRLDSVTMPDEPLPFDLLTDPFGRRQ